MAMKKTQKEIDPKLSRIQSLLESLLVAETPNSKRASFEQKWIVFFTILKIAEIDNPL